MALEVDKPSVFSLFNGRQHYEIPVFQRPYVWQEEDQWAPLWDDVIRVTESHLFQEDGVIPTVSHFLGAVVFEAGKASSAGVNRLQIIDGQQRLTTLQLLLHAVRIAISEFGEEEYEDEIDRLADLTRNPAKQFKNQPERFKVWPSRFDREAFEQVMESDLKEGKNLELGTHLITEAHEFFYRQAKSWITGEEGEDGSTPPADESKRIVELTNTLSDRLLLVSIDLSGDEDSQLIFETLNDRGTPLLKADLIKNWVFRRGIELDADVDAWADGIWDNFDGEWWREETQQGRVKRSRIDIFLQYWLTMRTFDEVKTELVFRKFTEYAIKHMSSVNEAEEFLEALRSDADTYQKLANLDAGTPAGRFRVQVVEAMELAATMPVFLWFISENHGVPKEQIEIGLGALESWATRRTLLRLTSKDINRHMVAILKDLSQVSPSLAGNHLRAFLSNQTADARYWPSDAHLYESLPTIKMYGSLKQSRIRAVLAAVERQLRLDSKIEAQELPSQLTIEHIMPREWRTFWDPEPKLDPSAAATRDALVNTIGNLTLITGSLNSSLKHRPWTDNDAAELKQGGSEGQGKRSLLEAYSILMMNKKLVNANKDKWTEQQIRDRAIELTNLIIANWPGPNEKVGQEPSGEKIEGGNNG